MSNNVLAVEDNEFNHEVLEAETPVLVDFWAEWCGPCKQLAPIVDDVAAANVGKVKFMKMDVDKNNQTPPRYGIRGIPTLMLFKNGAVEATHVGSLTKTQLQSFLDSHI